MRADDKDIVETLKACPENGFRMLMAKYQEAVYWHIRRLVVSHDDAQDASRWRCIRLCPGRAEAVLQAKATRATIIVFFKSNIAFITLIFYRVNTHITSLTSFKQARFDKRYTDKTL